MGIGRSIRMKRIIAVGIPELVSAGSSPAELDQLKLN